MALDLKELRQLTAPELVEKEKQLVQELFSLRFQLRHRKAGKSDADQEDQA